MVQRVFFVAVFAFLLTFGFSGSVFSQSKEALLQELNDAKVAYYAQRYEIDNQVRELSRAWHEQEWALHAKIKENPDQARAIRSELWEGAKELSQKKKALYDQLTPLRKSWYQKRMDLESQIAQIETAEVAERN